MDKPKPNTKPTDDPKVFPKPRKFTIYATFKPKPPKKGTR
jgi:hypothetical protein